MANKEDIFKIKHNNTVPEKGKILIAEPFLTDSCFQRSVILLTEHDSDGSMGLVLNKEIDLPLSLFIDPSTEALLIPVFLGGPVSSGTLLYIHSFGSQIPDSIEIADNVFLMGDLESIVYHLFGNLSDLDKIRFFLGYSGWTAGQLQNEIDHGSWIVSSLPDGNDIFTAKGESFWKQSVENVGGKYLKWLNYPQNPLLN
jgi:putative transcriptional regulator